MPSGFEYQQAREWMTAEVNAACDAAFENGIDGRLGGLGLAP